MTESERSARAKAILAAIKPLAIELPPILAAPLTPDERLRRVVMVCSSFARNLAYYRVGQEEAGALYIEDHSSFWRQVASNFFDLCVLDWCKLFGERCGRGKDDFGCGHHGWRVIASDPTRFEAEIAHELNASADELKGLVQEMREYRDKFVAHLDSERIMRMPMLNERAWSAVRFYHRHVVAHEVAVQDTLRGLVDTPEQMTLGYTRCIEEAREVYRQALMGIG